METSQVPQEHLGAPPRRAGPLRLPPQPRPSSQLLTDPELAPTHHEDAVRPPVGAVRVPPPVHHLGGHVLHRAAEGVGLVLVVYRLLAEAEV